MMKKLTATLLLGTALAMPAVAEEVDRKLDAASDGHVHVSNISGSITVKGWSRDEVEVTGELGRNVEELYFERNGDKITIKVKVPRKSKRGIESDLYIQVPEQSSLDVGTVSADIEVDEVFGDLKLNTVSGDIDADAVAADIIAGAVSGDVEVNGRREEAETRANSVSGDVTLFRVAGNIAAESVSGDIIIDEGAFDRVNMNTVNGEILFQSELRDGGKLKAETVNGSVDVEFVGRIEGRFEVDTFNGDIDNCFGPKAKRTSKYTPGWELEFVEGDGDARITISTLNGDVTICR
ncbi:MAG: DUF4097 family beta strand repeat-containing protein [Woeseiaceae bacterium]|nr:DUF4097 family beta strand repeat-containing protein [Woeseiaceae bacterium]